MSRVIKASQTTHDVKPYQFQAILGSITVPKQTLLNREKSSYSIKATTLSEQGDAKNQENPPALTSENNEPSSVSTDLYHHEGLEHETPEQRHSTQEQSDPCLDFASQQAHEAELQESYDKGFTDGFQQCQDTLGNEHREQLNMLEQLHHNFSSELSRFSAELAPSIQQLAITIAEHLVREELKTSPELILKVVSEALQMHDTLSTPTKVHLHPEDIEFIRFSLQQGSEYDALEFVPDSHINRGDVLINTPQGQSDGTMQTRWNQLLEQILPQHKDS